MYKPCHTVCTKPVIHTVSIYKRCRTVCTYKPWHTVCTNSVTLYVQTLSHCMYKACHSHCTYVQTLSHCMYKPCHIVYINTVTPYLCTKSVTLYVQTLLACQTQHTPYYTEHTLIPNLLHLMYAFQDYKYRTISQKTHQSKERRKWSSSPQGSV